MITRTTVGEKIPAYLDDGNVNLAALMDWAENCFVTGGFAPDEDISLLYAQPYTPERPMVCFDEKMMQLLAHTRPPLPLTPHRGRQQDYEYKREGTRNLCLFVEPNAGRRAVLVTPQRGKRDFAHAIRCWVDVLYPQAAVIDVRPG